MKARVYIAGPYQGSLMEGLDHIRSGIRAATELMLSGYTPYCPFIDWHFYLMLRENENLTINDFYECSLSWLYMSNAILVLPGWVKSKGVLAELKIAREERIPIFFSIEELKKAPIERIHLARRDVKNENWSPK